MESIFHYTSVSHCDNAMNVINKMRLSSEFCDVTIIIGNFHVMAHKIILSASAPYFYEMFKTNQEASASMEYHLKDVDVTSALKIIDFCYTSALSLDQDTVWPLLLVSNKLGCLEIASLCCEFLSSTLDLSSCIQTHLKADRNNCQSLLVSTLLFIADNCQKLCSHSSLHTLTSTELLELLVSLQKSQLSSGESHIHLVKSWLDHNIEERASVLQKLVQEIPELSPSLSQYFKNEGLENVSQAQEHDSSSDKNSEVVISPSHGMCTKLNDHICISCGDNFSNQLQLSAHQRVCAESAQSAPNEDLAASSTWPSNDDDKLGYITKSSLKCASTFLDELDQTPVKVIKHMSYEIVPRSKGLLSETEEDSKAVSHNAKNGLKKQPHGINVDVDIKQCSIETDSHNTMVPNFSNASQKHELSADHLNDTNNNDISNVEDNDTTSEEIDVVSYSDDLESGWCDEDKKIFKLNFSQSSSCELSCQICEKKFSGRKLLAKHWKRMHGIKEELGYQSLSKTLTNNDSGILEDADPIDISPNKKIKFDVKYKLKSEVCLGSLDNKEMDEIATHKSLDVVDPSNFLAPEFLKNYWQHCNELTRWCMGQGSALCQNCYLYHPSGSTCPLDMSLTHHKAASIKGSEEKDTEGRETGSNDFPDTASPKQGNINEVDADEGPLDMSKRSSGYTCSNSANSDVKSLKVPNSIVNNLNAPYFPSLLEISQYYNNMLAAAHSNGTEKGEYNLFHPDVKPFFSYPSPTAYPFDANTDKSNYNANREEESSQLNTVSTAHHKKKVAPRQRFFPCGVCNRVFSYQAALFTHMRTHSPSEQIYPCGQCQQRFSHPQELKAHVCPNGIEKPYTCSSCGQTFAKNIHLKRHLATHSGLKPYPCWVCGKRFSRSDHLKRHTQSIHAGSRPHGCQTCGKEFVRKYELNKHLLSHNINVLGEHSDTLDLSKPIHHLGDNPAITNCIS